MFPCASPLAQVTNISVPWTTRAITASEGSDFVAANGTVEFTPSSYGAQVVSVVVNGDNTFEGNETFAVDISPPAKYADASASSSVVTIVDDDPVSGFPACSLCLEQGALTTLSKLHGLQPCAPLTPSCSLSRVCRHILPPFFSLAAACHALLPPHSCRRSPWHQTAALRVTMALPQLF